MSAASASATPGNDTSTALPSASQSRPHAVSVQFGALAAFLAARSRAQSRPVTAHPVIDTPGQPTRTATAGPASPSDWELTAARTSGEAPGRRKWSPDIVMDATPPAVGASSTRNEAAGRKRIRLQHASGGGAEHAAATGGAVPMETV